MSRVYCDTNILVPVIILESQSFLIRTWISSPDVTPVVSDLVVLEFSATISRVVRERTLSDALGRDAVSEFEAWRKTLGRPLTITRQMFAIARTIVEDATLGVRGPDALHLALLQVTGLPFATFDARLARSAAGVGLTTTEPPPL